MTTRLVDRSDSSCHQTVASAVTASRPGDRVLVRPGHYVESIRIDHQISLEGDGPPDEIVIEAADAPCLVITGQGVRLAGLSLTGGDGPGDLDEDSYVASGTLIILSDTLLERVSIRDGFAINIQGGTVIVRDCTVNSIGYVGVMISDGATATIEGTEIEATLVFGVEVKDAGTSATIRDLRLHDVGVGIYVRLGATATIEGSEIYRNRSAGVRVESPGSEAAVRQAHIHHNGGVGVSVSEGATGTVEDCHIHHNNLSGVDVQGSGTWAAVRNNSIHDNHTFGVIIDLGGSALIEGNEVLRNGQPGIWIDESANTSHLSGNRERDNWTVRTRR